MNVIGIYTLLTTGLCILMGYGGQASLGQAAFFGIGAYASGILTKTYHLNPWLAMILAALITTCVALVIGIPILKLKEHYLALASLGFGVIIYYIITQWDTLTGGPNGFVGVPYLAIGGYEFNNDVRFYYLVWLFCFIGIIAASNLVESRIGRALRSIHGSEVAAETLGVFTHRLKVKIFALSALYASVAGSLYAHYMNVLDPFPFSINASLEFLLMAVVGGITNIWGPLFGVTFITILNQFLQSVIPRFIPSAGGEFQIVFYGIILVIIMIYLPEGLVSGFGSIVRKWRFRIPYRHKSLSKSELVQQKLKHRDFGDETLQ